MAQKGKQKKDNLKKQLQELEEKYKRALADYQNLEKRAEKEKQEFLKFATSSLVAKLLTVLDSLEAAQKHLKDQGLNLLIKEFKEILKQEGVVEIESIGQSFDPEIYECLELVEVKDKNLIETVVEETRKGYRLQVGDESRVLRYPQVKVGKKVNDLKNLKKEEKHGKNCRH